VCGFLWVEPVIVHLEKNSDIHKHLKEAADPELHGSLSLESVSTGPVKV